MEKKKPTIAIILPCFNEEEALPQSLKRICKLLKELIGEKTVSRQSFILCVDDGSSDKTWGIIKGAGVCGLRFAHNFGHQSALLAGLIWAGNRCDAAITIDADLQDDISVIPQFIKAFIQGSEIVYGVRKKRDKDKFFKRTTALAFYKLMAVLGSEAIPNHADFRLTGRRAIAELAKYRGKELYLRGFFPSLRFESAIVYYDRGERVAGTTKYPFAKMLKFALSGIKYRFFGSGPARRKMVWYEIAEVLDRR